ncbi:MAG: hypothetical protein K2X82_30025 [Gemmataceae bacterium]|nr:hypothetical protein [Gemmataceae bacterium]
MTPVLNAPRFAKTAPTARPEQLLRDAAFVLKMTRRVKADILRDAAGPRRPADRARPDTAPALGV